MKNTEYWHCHRIFKIKHLCNLWYLTDISTENCNVITFFTAGQRGKPGTLAMVFWRGHRPEWQFSHCKRPIRRCVLLLHFWKTQNSLIWLANKIETIHDGCVWLLRDRALPQGKKEHRGKKVGFFLSCLLISIQHPLPSLHPSLLPSSLCLSLLLGILHLKWCKERLTLHFMYFSAEQTAMCPRDTEIWKNTWRLTSIRTNWNARACKHRDVRGFGRSIWNAPVVRCTQRVTHMHAVPTHTHTQMSHLYVQPNGLPSAASPPIKLL